MNRRLVLLAAGTLLAIGGLALAAAPGLAADLEWTQVVRRLAAIAAVVAGLVRGYRWYGHEPATASPAERERTGAFAVPGESFDERLAGAPTLGATGGDTLTLSLRQELRETAVEVLTRFGGYDEAAAIAALDDGTWTNDRYAAEFFATRSGSGGSVAEAVAGTVYGRGPFHRRAERAATEIERLSRGERS